MLGLGKIKYSIAKRKEYLVIKCEDSGSDSDRPHSSTPTSSSHMNAAAAVAAAAASVPQTGNPLLFPFPSLLANPFLAAANHLHRQHQHHAAAIQPPPPLPHILPQNLTTAHLDGMILDSMLVFKGNLYNIQFIHQLFLYLPFQLIFLSDSGGKQTEVRT